MPTLTPARHYPHTQVRDTSYGLTSSVWTKDSAVADAFVRKDQKRTGAFTRRQFRDVMYSLDVPLTEAQVERVFVTFDQQNEGTLGWEKVRNPPIDSNNQFN